MNNPYSAPSAPIDDIDLGEDTYKPIFFSLQGRIGRLHYLGYSWLASFLVVFIAGILAAVTIPLMGSKAGGAAGVVAIIFYYVAIFAVAFIYARRRLHDLDKGGVWFLLSLVPLVNIGFWLYLIFAPGTDGSNSYGPKPEKGSAWWLLIIIVPVMIIGILAAVAIPAYQQYVARAKALQVQQLQQQQQAPQDQQSQ